VRWGDAVGGITTTTSGRQALGGLEGAESEGRQRKNKGWRCGEAGGGGVGESKGGGGEVAWREEDEADRVT
jgi:hypothetical protein